MPRVRYTCPVPAGPGMTAFAPIPMHYAGARTAYKQMVTGQPGTLGVPAPTWNTRSIDQFRPDDLGIGSKNQPDTWYPSIYYQRQDISYGIGGVAVFSDNLLPHPAIDPRLAPMNTTVVINSRNWENTTAGPLGQARGNNYTQPVGRQSGSQRQIRWPKRTPVWRGIFDRGRDHRG